MAADDVADAMVDVALAAPINGLIEIAGPERAPMAEFVAHFLTSSDDTRKVTTDRNATYFGTVIDDETLLPGSGARIGTTHLDEWLSTART